MPGISGGLLVKAKAREARLEATITRADGSVEHLGEIAYWHRNPFKRLWRNFLIYLRRKDSK